MSMKVVGFYTQGTPYEGEIGEMVLSAAGFGLEAVAHALPHPGSWRKAALLLPQCISRERERSPKDVLLYLDADARIKHRPILPEGDYDVGLYYLPNSPRSRFPNGEELCTGTCVWWPTPVANELLESWSLACSTPEADSVFGLDQEILQGLVEQRPALKVWRMPPEWCWMDTISRLHYGNREPVIFHGQASRRYKQLVSAR